MVLNLLVKSFQLPRVGVVRVRAFLVNFEAHVAVDPSFIKDQAKSIFFGSLS